MDINQLLHQVILPVLDYLELPKPEAAAELLLGTAIQESQAGHYIKQLGNGPALGIYQMEPATHDDIWTNYLAYHGTLANMVERLRGTWPTKQQSLIYNLAYSTAMCRIHYYRVPAPLPLLGDLPAQAAYWKAHYNTRLGKGTTEEYIAAVGPALPDSVPKPT